MDTTIEKAKDFLQAVMAETNPSTAYEMLNHIEQVLGSNFAAHVFGSVLGEGTNPLVVVRLIDMPPSGGRIEAIKLIRKYTGATLKAAKDLTDIVIAGKPAVLSFHTREDAQIFIDDMAQQGARAHIEGE